LTNSTRSVIESLARLVPQALAEQCHVVTVDAIFSDYGVPVIW
jgi:PIN domain nuclease of toxin-antitoxin system